MIKIESNNSDVLGIAPAIYSMRNPMNSWGLSTSHYNEDGSFEICDADLDLAHRLICAGPSHRKFRRMIEVYANITAPLYFWKQFDTYKVGTVSNSCSTMHKLCAKEFEWSDFSTEHLFGRGSKSWVVMQDIIDTLNEYRDDFLKSQNKDIWWQIVQLLPTSYNQMRTVMVNYETLSEIWFTRMGHKLDEWEEFRKWSETLPYAKELIKCEKRN